jgi:tetratricopeptide (TPR) repeat protein
MKSARYLFARCGIVVAAALWLAPAAAAGSQPSPELSALEPRVAAQLRLAQEALTRALAANRSENERAALFADLGRLYQAYALNDEAAAAFGRAIELNPQDYRWHYHRAALHAEAGRTDEAEAGYRRVLALNPDLLVVHFRLAQLYRQGNRLDQADAELATLTAAFARQAPQFAALLAERGELRLAQGRHADAVDDLKPALAAVPAADRLHYPLAMAYRGLGEAQLARAELAQAGKAGLKYPDPLLDSLADLLRGERVQLLRGQAAFRAGDHGAAAEAFREALAAEPDSVTARIDLSAALGASGKTGEAMQLLQEAVAMEPRNATARFNLGLLQLGAGDAAGAADHLQKAALLRPDDGEVHLPLARALSRAGRGAEAAEQYARARRSAPQDPAAWLESADLLSRGGQPAATLAVLEEGHRNLPDNGAIAHALAWMLAAAPEPGLRDGARALGLAQRVFAARPSAHHGETLAAALAESGRCAEAASLQQQVAEQVGKSGDAAWLGRSESALRHYRDDRPCRP